MEEKFWISSNGKFYDLKKLGIKNHYTFFNKHPEGIQVRKFWGYSKPFSEKDNIIAIKHGWIRGLEIYDTLNLSYLGDYLTKRPTSYKAKDELFDHLEGIDNVQVDLILNDGSQKAYYFSLKDFLSLIETRRSHDKVNKILRESNDMEK